MMQFSSLKSGFSGGRPVLELGRLFLDIIRRGAGDAVAGQRFVQCTVVHDLAARSSPDRLRSHALSAAASMR